MAANKSASRKTGNVKKKTAEKSSRRSSLVPKPKSARKGGKTVPGTPASRESAPKKPASKKKVKPATGKTTRQSIAETPASAASRPSVVNAAHISAEDRNVRLRRTLIQKREDIVREVRNEISKYIKGETRQLVDTALDDGDWSVVDLSEDISFKHMSTHRENLIKIDEALRKLSEGTYGICEDCGDEISARRLKILPFAIYCTDCQEHREQLEELAKQENLIG